MKSMKARVIILFFGAACLLGLSGFESSDIVYDKCGSQKYYQADCSGFVGEGAGEARNVILIIGDGMGINQVYAGRVFVNGPSEPFAWENFPHQGLVTSCAIGTITDSAASGTAMATGHKTLNGQVSTSQMPEYKEYESILERVKDRKAAGLVTTTSLWDATPAVFAAHAHRRSQSRDIARQMAEDTGPEVMLGGGARAFTGEGRGPDLTARAAELGYTVVRDAEELKAINAGATTKLLGLFNDSAMTYEHKRPAGSREPHLSEMTTVALDILDNDPRGFFLMIEGARIDHACHAVSMNKLVKEMAEFDKTVNVVLDWAEDHPDTLVLITADHETGGIEVIPGDYIKGDRIRVKWTTALLNLHANHSSQRIPIYGRGPNSGAIKEHMDNTEVYCVIRNAFGE